MPPLRLIIVATPKTGNTWVKHLLGAIYDLPLRDLPVDWRALDWGAVDEQWIGHQHYLPTEEFLRAAQNQGVRFVTTTRHPGDSFISLLHHVRRETGTSENPFDATYMKNDAAPFGPRCAEYLATGYYQHLQLSLDWMRVPGVSFVRYEALCADPIETLRKLTRSIAPVSDARLRRAFCECEIDVLRKKNPARGNFFRTGGCGGWIDQMPPAFKEIFRQVSPLPAQSARLGYSMDETDQRNAFRGPPRRLRFPLRQKNAFDNGVPVVPILIQAYFDAPEELAQNWPETTEVGNGSFFSWLNSPVNQRSTDGVRPELTQLAWYVYTQRPDVRAVFPEVHDAHRHAYVMWFVTKGRQGYGLHDAFGLACVGYPRAAASGRAAPLPFDATHFENGVAICPVIIEAFYALSETVSSRWLNPLATGPDSFFEWLRKPAIPRQLRRAKYGGGTSDLVIPVITELAAFVHSIRPDVRSVFHDIFGEDRASYVNWYNHCASTEYALAPEFYEPHSEHASVT